MLLISSGRHAGTGLVIVVTHDQGVWGAMMGLLLVGLVLFLGVHAVTILRPQRDALIGRVGEGAYKGIYSLVSLIGFVVLIYGYGAARLSSANIVFWTPPAFLGHVAALLMLFAFIALAATYAPNGLIKSTLKHPMITAVKAWAFAHLLVNGDLASIILFGSFLAWGVIDRISLKRRPDASEPPKAGFGAGDIAAIGIGTVATIVMMIWLHPILIGVPASLR